jgi:hypothetical protein
LPSTAAFSTGGGSPESIASSIELEPS